MGERRDVYRDLLGKREEKRPLARPKITWEYNIKMGLQEVGCRGYGLDQAVPGQGQMAGACQRGNEPSGSIKCWEFFD